PLTTPPFPYTTLFRSSVTRRAGSWWAPGTSSAQLLSDDGPSQPLAHGVGRAALWGQVGRIISAPIRRTPSKSCQGRFCRRLRPRSEEHTSELQSREKL